MLSRRRASHLILSLVVATTIVGLSVWRLTWLPPSWYALPDVDDQQVVRLADDVEYRLLEESHRSRGTDELWTIRLREHQANAWLAVRLHKWVEFERDLEWPDVLGTPQIRIDAEDILLACDIKTASGRRFVVLRMVPMIKEEQLYLTTSGISLGRVALGSPSADRILSFVAPDRKSALLESELGGVVRAALTEYVSVSPVAALSDGRRVELRAIALHKAAIDLTFATMLDE